jgi:hypothetical protein
VTTRGERVSKRGWRWISRPLITLPGLWGRRFYLGTFRVGRRAQVRIFGGRSLRKPRGSSSQNGKWWAKLRPRLTVSLFGHQHILTWLPVFRCFGYANKDALPQAHALATRLGPRSWTFKLFQYHGKVSTLKTSAATSQRKWPKSEVINRLSNQRRRLECRLARTDTTRMAISGERRIEAHGLPRTPDRLTTPLNFLMLIILLFSKFSDSHSYFDASLREHVIIVRLCY